MNVFRRFIKEINIEFLLLKKKSEYTPFVTNLKK